MIGVPWRTAARANRYRVSTSCAHRKVVASSSFKSNNNEDDDEYEEEDDDEHYDELIEEYNQNKDNFQEETNPMVEFLDADVNRIHRIKVNTNNSSNNNNTKDNMNRLSRVSQDENIEHMNRMHLMMASSTFDHDKLVSSSGNRVGAGSSSSSNVPNRLQPQRKQIDAVSKNELALNLDKSKNMSVKDLLVILQREQESKTQLEDMLIRVSLITEINISVAAF